MAALGLLFNSGGPIIRRDPLRPAVSVGMQLGLGTGFEFDDGRQLLVSVQKPIGMMLEQDTAAEGSMPGWMRRWCARRFAASRAGIEAGYRLLAVNNMDVRNEDLDQVMTASGAHVSSTRFRTAEQRGGAAARTG